MQTPELNADPEVVDWIASVSSLGLELLERMLLGEGFQDRFLGDPGWLRFTETIRSLWAEHDHCVVRGLPVADGAPLMLASLAFSVRFKPYREQRVVKHFRMSPWTIDLSHTLREGHFHTDINTAPNPPAATAIQCRVADPGRPRFGEVRVARLADLLRYLQSVNAQSTIAYLVDREVTMVNDRAEGSWTGRIVTGDRIRFHPETIRAAHRRYRVSTSDVEELEEHLTLIQRAALAVSQPIQLEVGDVLFVSNLRALHYRGACSVVFDRFPRDFRSREIFVLHLLGEPS